MFLPEDLEEFLKRECITTRDEQDPRKPFILENGFIAANPRYDPSIEDREWRERELERRRTSLGTSFFLNFDPLCNLHQQDGVLGDRLRQEIATQARERFLCIFARQFPECPPPMRSLEQALKVSICSGAQRGFNNGEMYLWLRGLPLKEEIAFMVLRALKESFENDPIVVAVNGKSYEVSFYGWGIRYY